MSEPYTIVLQQAAVFDGTTLIGGTRSDFSVSNRTYTRNLDGGGVVPADFWSLFSADSPKIVGISARTRNPYDIARVITGGTFAQFREEIDLRPLVQHVIMYPGDQLALQTIDRGIPVELLVQPLSESDHVGWAKRYEPLARTRRFRITRGDQSGWVPGANPPPLVLGWAWDPVTGFNSATTTNQGVFPLSSFFGPRVVEGVEAWVRVSGVTGANVYVRAGGPNGSVQLISGTLTEGHWSDRFHIGFDDLIQIATAAPQNASVQVDIEFGPPRHRRCPCPKDPEG
ncbi:MAG: hypothetical protein H6713_43005 [Myxococcales bacterium]|nr:hypothetical protein [Myxococcales bacterium]